MTIHESIPDTPSFSLIIERDREIDRDRQTTPHTPHTPHTIEKRIPIHIRMRKSIHGGVMRYCGNELTGGEFYESAASFYIKHHPKENVYIEFVEPTISDVGEDDELQQIICIHDLESCLKNMPKTKPIHISYKRKLLKILKGCRKVNNRGDKLKELIEEAKQYFE